MQLHGFIIPIKMAEEEGFEPSRQVLAHQHAFQACALNRSATPPGIIWRRGWDSNPRDGFGTAYPISSRAPSTSSDTSPTVFSWCSGAL